MKKTIKTVALIAVLGMVTVSCQKENYSIDSVEVVASEQQASWVMHYSVDGVTNTVPLYTEEEYRAFIYRMLSLSEQGCVVVFFDELKYNPVPSKEVHSFTTSDKTEALNWASKMESDGYTVTVVYDEDKGIYHCWARK